MQKSSPLTEAKFNAVTQILGCVAGADPVCSVENNQMTIKTGNGSVYRIEHEPVNYMFSLFVIMKDKILPTLGVTEKEVLLVTRRSFRKICIEMAKWELYRAIRRNFKV